MRIYKGCCFNKSSIAVLILVLFGLSACTFTGKDESASVRRYVEQEMLYEVDNEFWTSFKISPVAGFDRNEGLSRRDPSSVIKVNDTYYVWYTRLSEIWHATSRDGYNWKEQGVAISPEPGDGIEDDSFLNSDVLLADGKYYLFYGNPANNSIGMSSSDLPDGPWTGNPDPVLLRGSEGEFDEFCVQDPYLIVKGGKYYMYYRGQTEEQSKTSGNRYSWGVAIANNPEGPYKKSKINPLLFGGDEGILFYPYREGICAILPQGPERGSVQYSVDGLNFYPKAHGVRDKYYGGPDTYPVSAGGFRADIFQDIEEEKGSGLTWGLYNKTISIDGQFRHNLARFDCDLSLHRGDSLRIENEIWYRLMQSSIQQNNESAATKRIRTLGLLYEEENEFYTEFRNTPISGLGLEEGISRRDPSGVIKVDCTYYVWYTRAVGPPVAGQENANDTLRAYHYDLADIGYATSKDGLNWTEQGVAAVRGPEGSFDHRTIFTPDVLVANGKYYLFYQAAGELSQGLGWDFGFNLIGMSWADSPEGPWHRHPDPVLNLGPKGSFDELNMHDPSFIVKGGKYYLYYKGQPVGPELARYLEGRDSKYGTRLAWGVAIADNPEGPYIKSKFNPVICAGHEIIVFPYGNGICALLNQGPEKGSLQFSEDGINFYPKVYGLVDIPHAAGYYRVGNFADIETVAGQGITWGFRNRMGTIDGHRWNFLSRWDCDLSLN